MNEAGAQTDDAPKAPRQSARAAPGLWAPLIRRLSVAFAVLLILLIGAGVAIRYGVRTPAGRSMVSQLLDGMDLGPVGRLHVEGMSGDLFDDFGFRKLSIVDAKGPWLEIDDVTLVWDPAELLARRVHATHLHARLVHVLRSPLLVKQPPQPPSKPPVSLIVDDLQTRIETEPAFSVQHGLWDLAARADLRRNGRMQIDLTARSRLHAGDGATVAFRIGRRQRFFLKADAVEAGGGALAGALGLAANQSLNIHAQGEGDAALGQARLKALSGASTPVELTAGWSQAGATVSGRASLTASRFTRTLADRLGPEARIRINGRQIKGDVYAINGGATAPGGSIQLNGPVNWARRSTSGLDVALATSDLSKWEGAAKIGPARARGVVVGDQDRFTFKGSVQAERLDQAGYALSRIAGPATLALKDREWRVQADLAGAGGSGQASFAKLLGAAPHLQFDLSLLKDRRFLFRSLNVKGAGATLTAAGGQGLFGRLSFKGTAQLASLATLRPGAKGGLSATWDAGENRDGKLWDFSFDAKGSNFASGLGDLDHFLGSAPHLTAQGSYGQGALSVTEAKLSGATVQASGKGGLDAKQALAVTFDWSAKGPIVAGPMEIAGAAKGTGRISGTLSAPRADLTAELASLDFGQLVVTPARLTLSFLWEPDGVVGAAAAAGPSSKYGPASAKAAFRFAGDGVDLSDIVADAGGVKLAGALALRSGEPSSADLSFAAGPGAFLSSGQLTGKVKIAGRPDGATANLSIDGASLSIPGAPTTLRALTLRAAGPLKQLPFQVSADSIAPIAWRFTGGGVLARDKAGSALTLHGQGRIRKADFKLLEPATVRFGGAEQSLRLQAAVAGGKVQIDARQGPGGVDAKASLSDVGLGAFNEDFTGTASGALTLNGHGASLGGSLNATLAGARSRDAPPNEGLKATVTATLANDRLHVEANATDAEGLKSNGAIDLPTEASAAPFRIAINRIKPVRGQFSAEGEIRPLWDLLAGGERTLSGHLATSGVVQGSLSTMMASGQGGLTNGKFRDVSTGLALQDLQVDTTFGENAVTVRRFSGGDGRGGSVSGDGRVSFAQDGASTFTLNLKRFQLIDNDVGRATASGAVTVTHPAKGQGKLTGNLVIDRADIVANTPTPSGVVPMDVIEVHQVIKEGREAPQPRALGPPIDLDVGIKATRGVYVKGKGLSVELSLDSHVGGTIAQPDLTGVARVVAGSYDFAGKRFDVDSAGLIRLGGSPDQIRLSLSATWEDPTLTAVVRVRGTAAKPEITLTSTPVLPQDEVLSRVLFGVSASQLSPAQGAELASALASLTGGGGFDVIGNLRQFAGLDRLALGGNQTTGTTISGGKYLNKDVYLEITGGGRNGSGAQVEWRIRHNLSLVSRYGAALDPRYSNDSDASLSIRFRKDF